MSITITGGFTLAGGGFTLEPAPTSLYSFTTFTFTNASATGATGPTLANCQTAYAGQVWLSSYFTVSPQGFQQWTVPATGNYTVTVAGAAGGGGVYPSNAAYSGSGRIISQTLALTKNDVLILVVGQAGVQGTYTGGGGGGSFVIRSGTVLMAAGGGGGKGNQAGSNSRDTVAGNPSTGGAAGASGGGGGGGGFGGNGGGTAGTVAGGGGNGYSSNFTGGAGGTQNQSGAGGFGGGGGGGNGNGDIAGGGGGGYSGGDGALGVSPFTASQGGSCYVASGSPTYVGYQAGQGYITITAA